MSEAATLNPAARREARPAAEDIRGVCPVCGSDVVSLWYYVPKAGYVLLWLCWEAEGDSPSCDYRKVL